MSDVVGRLKYRIEHPHPYLDNARTPYPRLSDEEITGAEERLGFAIPLLLRHVFIEIGNGGFGPGHGILGLEGGATDDLGRTAFDLYLLWSGDEPAAWPEGLLPFCYWGCDVYSSAYCVVNEVPVVRQDSNIDYEDAFESYRVSNAIREHDAIRCFAKYGDLHGTSWVEARSMEEWLNAWLDGKDIWRMGRLPLKPSTGQRA